MNELPTEIFDRILFKKTILSKIDKSDNSMNSKLNLYFNMLNIKMVNEQLKYLITEYKYQKNDNIRSYWYSTRSPVYIYILYKNRSKKNIDKNF